MAFEAKYPDIFTEYHERDNFEHLGFSNEEYKLITEHISKESEIELFLDGYEYSNNNEIALFHVILWWVAFFFLHSFWYSFRGKLSQYTLIQIQAVRTV